MGNENYKERVIKSLNKQFIEEMPKMNMEKIEFGE
jgi:hypothetical protein